MNSINLQTDNKNTTRPENEEEKNFIHKETKIDIESKTVSAYSYTPTIKKSSVNNFNNLILSCVKNEEYCFTMLDYLKKMCHYSQLDYFSTYTQLLYCFKPKEM
jgi:hypothetical protein